MAARANTVPPAPPTKAILYSSADITRDVVRFLNV